MEKVKLANALLNELAFGKDWAELQTDCLRKGVGCSLGYVHHEDGDDPEDGTFNILRRAHNGPSRSGQFCTNVVGNCGCSHSEPRVIMMAFYNADQIVIEDLIMVCTYSPCTNCANVIIDSGIVKGIVWEILTEHDERGAHYLREVMPVLTRDHLRSWLEKEAQGGATFDILRRWSNPTSED